MSIFEFPRIVAVCPTYGRPTLARRILSCFLTQHYPPERCQLLIVDDADQIRPQKGPNWEVVSFDQKFPDICAKYRWAFQYALQEYNPDAFALMDDDDHYLPGYLYFHGAVLGRWEYPWSKDSFVMSDYAQPGDSLIIERSDGRFHGSIGFTAEFYKHINGYVETRRPTFDQEFIAHLAKHGSRGTVPGYPQYIYRWSHSGFPHATNTMPKGEDWYDLIKITENIRIETLTPAYDSLARAYTMRYSGREPVGELVG